MAKTKTSPGEEPEEDVKNDKEKSKEDKSREAMLAQLRKKLGLNPDDKSIMSASDYDSVTDVISTGHSELDRLITPVFYEKNGRGGVPRGYLCEFFGPNSGGKTCLCYKLAATLTKEQKYVYWQDAEGSFQREFAEVQGVDSRFIQLHAKPGMTAEEYLEALKKSAESGLNSLCVVDSLSGLTPKRCLECDLSEDERMGEKARLMSRALPKIVDAARIGGTTVIFINQLRTNIGVMYGNPEMTPGGVALKFFSSLRLRLQQVSGKANRGIVKDGEEIGIRSKVEIVKSRFGPPFKESFIPIYYGNDKPSEMDILLDIALSNKVIRSRANKKAGTTTFSLEIPYMEPLREEDIDELKDKLDAKYLKGIVAALGTLKVTLDPSVIQFVEKYGEKNEIT